MIPVPFTVSAGTTQSLFAAESSSAGDIACTESLADADSELRVGSQNGLLGLA